MRMQVILDSSFARPGSAPIWGGKKGEFRDWTSLRYDAPSAACCAIQVLKSLPSKCRTDSPSTWDFPTVQIDTSHIYSTTPSSNRGIRQEKVILKCTNILNIIRSLWQWPQMQTYDLARAALWDTAIKFSLQSRSMTSPDHLVRYQPMKHSYDKIICFQYFSLLWLTYRYLTKKVLNWGRRIFSVGCESVVREEILKQPVGNSNTYDLKLANIMFGEFNVMTVQTLQTWTKWAM